VCLRVCPSRKSSHRTSPSEFVRSRSKVGPLSRLDNYLHHHKAYLNIASRQGTLAQHNLGCDARYNPHILYCTLFVAIVSATPTVAPVLWILVITGENTITLSVSVRVPVQATDSQRHSKLLNYSQCYSPLFSSETVASHCGATPFVAPLSAPPQRFP
jgi:hypothetical protein